MTVWPETMTQTAPYPTELAELTKQLRYRPGWHVQLANMERDHAGTHRGAAGGLTLVVYARVYDTYHPERLRPVNHYFEVPAATFNREAWRRWLLDCLLRVEQHEACEWFAFEQGAGPADWFRPFAPTHGPGANPYTITQLVSDEARRTSAGGEVKP